MGKPGKPGSAAFGWLGPLSKHDLSFAGRGSLKHLQVVGD